MARRARRAGHPRGRDEPIGRIAYVPPAATPAKPAARRDDCGRARSQCDGRQSATCRTGSSTSRRGRCWAIPAMRASIGTAPCFYMPVRWAMPSCLHRRAGEPKHTLPRPPSPPSRPYARFVAGRAEGLRLRVARLAAANLPETEAGAAILGAKQDPCVCRAARATFRALFFCVTAHPFGGTARCPSVEHYHGRCCQALSRYVKHYHDTSSMASPTRRPVL